MKRIIKQESQRKSKVLIVDDVPKNLQVLGSILTSKGIEVGFSTSGEDALKSIDYMPPDLILLDIAMPPGMSGFDVCVQLKENERTKDIPVIFLTARDQSEDIVRGFEIGAVDYVTKPFNKIELLARVETHLELKRQREMLEALNQALEDKVARRTEQLQKAVMYLTDAKERLSTKNKKLQKQLQELRKEQEEQ